MADQRGQASVEFVAATAALVVVVALAIQAGLAGWSLWSAANAARIGARTAHVDGPAIRRARAALPDSLRRGSRVRADGRVRVRVRVPSVLPRAPRFRVSASTELEPDDG